MTKNYFSCKRIANSLEIEVELCPLMEKNEPLAFLFGVLAALSYAAMAMFVKLADEVPSLVIVFFRNLVSLIALTPLFFSKKNFSLTTQKTFLHFLRCFIGLTGMFCFVIATKGLILVDAVLLVNITPLVIPLVVYLWHKEVVSKKRLAAIALGFLGIALILRPSFSFFHIYGIIGLASGCFIGTASVIVKELSKTEPTERILFYFFTGSTLLFVIPLFSSWKAITSIHTWSYVIASGLASFFYQLFMTKAYSYGSATRVSIISYLGVVFSGLLGWVVWKNLPSFWSFIGMIIVISSGIIVLLETDNKKSLSTKKG